MILTQTTAPAETPIALDDLKEHLRVSHTAQDDFLTGLIAVVTGEMDGPSGWLRRAIVTQEWKMQQAAFPLNGFKPWLIPLPPLQSVDSVKYYDADNSLQTLSTSVYSVFLPSGGAGYILLGKDQAWPEIYDRADAVEVHFTAGYGAQADCPAQLAHGLKMLAASLYTNRGDKETARGLDETLKHRILGPYRWREMA